MVQDYDTKIDKLMKKIKDLNDRILVIENKYQYIARSETKQLYKSKAEVNDKILKLRKAKQDACKHSDYEIETVDIGTGYIEDFCTNCKLSLGYNTAYNRKMGKELQMKNTNV